MLTPLGAKEVVIGDRLIGSSYPPFIIAEMSGNHNQSLEQALEIVDVAAASGAHAIKLQTYTADTMTLQSAKDDFQVKDVDSLWYGRSLYSLYEQAATPWEWHEQIFARAKMHGMLAFSSPFDASAVDFLEELDVPAYKIASFENIDLPLIAKVARTAKPIIISTGMATIAEIHEAVTCARDNGCNQLILLKCTSSYPASPSQSNLLTIPHLAEMMDCPVGLSDHTLGIGVAIASVALGACVIEKHLITSRAAGGVDADFSMEPHELRLLVEESARAQLALGKVFYGQTEVEKNSTIFRRSIYISKDIKAGEQLTEENMRIIRPGYGLPPEYYEKVLGKTLKNDIESGTALSWELLQ